MASLLSLIKDGRLRVWAPDTGTWNRDAITEKVRDFIVSEDTVKVRADSVANSLRFGEAYELASYSRLMPPYPRMWIESVITPSHETAWRGGILVQRLEKENCGAPHLPDLADDGVVIALDFYEEVNGTVIGQYRFDYLFLDENHKLRESPTYGRDHRKMNLQEMHMRAETQAVVALETLQRLNCDNVTLARGASSSKSGKPQPNGSIVWHTIKVSESKTRTTTLSASGETPTIRRYHWVRGHYADYTKGKGLFGRIKGLFWIPEHDAGSLEAGAVLKDYETA